MAYETATEAQKDYASVLAGAAETRLLRPVHLLRPLRAPCTAGIDIAAVNKFYDLAVMQSEVPASIREHYRALDAAADDCTACAAPASRAAPFGVPIAERMEKAAELFA